MEFLRTFDNKSAESIICSENAIKSYKARNNNSRVFESLTVFLCFFYYNSKYNINFFKHCALKIIPNINK